MNYLLISTSAFTLLSAGALACYILTTGLRLYYLTKPKIEFTITNVNKKL